MATKVAAKKPHETSVIHAKVGNNHLVGLKALRVLLLKDGDGWFAQGLEIDYAACASDIEKVKKNFEVGLALTMKEHLTMYGNLEKLLKVAPQEAWKEYLDAPPKAVKAEYSTVEAYNISKQVKVPAGGTGFPFDAIQFIQPQKEAEAVAA